MRGNQTPSTPLCHSPQVHVVAGKLKGLNPKKAWRQTAACAPDAAHDAAAGDGLNPEASAALGRGARVVGILMDPSPEYVAAVLACVAAG
jgi:hypothetical protein